MNTVFWDTSFIIALEDTTDQYHLRAKEYWKDNFLRTFSKVVVTSFIFDEVVTHFNNMNYIPRL